MLKKSKIFHHIVLNFSESLHAFAPSESQKLWHGSSLPICGLFVNCECSTELILSKVTQGNRSSMAKLGSVQLHTVLFDDPLAWIYLDQGKHPENGLRN